VSDLDLAKQQEASFKARIRELDLPTETMLLIDLYAIAKAQVAMERMRNQFKATFPEAA
jgi:hypothetical protein